MTSAISKTSPSPQHIRFAFIRSCWHDDIVNQGRDAFLAEMKRLGVAPDAIDLLEVPGAFELPLLAKRLARSGGYAAIVACGFVVNGGIYDVEKGAVAWLGSHPTQDAVIVQAEEAEKVAELARATRAAREAAAEHPSDTPVVQDTADEASQEAVHAPARPLPSFPSSLLPSKDVKARTRTKPQDTHSEPHH